MAQRHEFSSPDRNKTHAYSKKMLKFRYILDISQNFFFGRFLETQVPGLCPHTVADVVEGEHASCPGSQLWRGLPFAGNAICTQFWHLNVQVWLVLCHLSVQVWLVLCHLNVQAWLVLCHLSSGNGTRKREGLVRIVEVCLLDRKVGSCGIRPGDDEELGLPEVGREKILVVCWGGLTLGGTATHSARGIPSLGSASPTFSHFSLTTAEQHLLPFLTHVSREVLPSSLTHSTLSQQLEVTVSATAQPQDLSHRILPFQLPLSSSTWPQAETVLLI